MGKAEPRAAIVCVSKHRGNTRRIADVLAEALNAEIFLPEQLTPQDLSRYELVGFGSGIYYGRLHASLLAFAQATNGHGRQAFIYSTAGLSFLSCGWHMPLRRRLHRCGWKIVGEFTCRGWDSWGPLKLIGGLNRRRPNERDLDRTRAFARLLRSRVAEDLASTEISPLPP